MKKEYEDRTEYYNELGQVHRDHDLPAIEYKNGNKCWCINGKIHRENDLPAVEDIDGYKEWRINGKRHRENGPAVEYYNRKSYYLNDNLLFKDEYEEELIKIKLNRLKNI